jgi:hypothetical protein
MMPASPSIMKFKQLATTDNSAITLEQLFVSLASLPKLHNT